MVHARLWVEAEHKPGDAREHLQQAILLAGNAKLAEAQAHCAKALLLSPNHLGTLHLSGVIACQLGQSRHGIELLNRAIGINPDVAEVHNDRGMALRGVRSWDEALASFDKAIALKPDYAVAHYNRALMLHHNLGRLYDAIASYDMAIQLKGDLVGSYNNRAAAFYELRRWNDALADFDKVIQLKKDDKTGPLRQETAQAYCNRGNVLLKLGRLDGAIADYSKAIELNPNECSFYLFESLAFERLNEPGLALDVLREAQRRFGDNEEVPFHLARLADDPPPTSAPASHVARLFDGYADRFESHLVEGLQYRAPELIASCLLKHAAPRALDILDLGCGTGLMGALLATRKRAMVGVDLSGKMIAKAKKKGIYDELHVAEIVAFLTASHRRFDVVLAADVFIYLGDLSPVLPAVRRVLVASGLFAFSAERCAEGEYTLNKSGRYSHSEDYIRRVASTAGFETLCAEAAILRHEKGTPVEGFIAVLRVRPDR
jgi:predicted TPR repeat methyltransferase